MPDKESIFRARVQRLHRIAIPKAVYEALEIEEGDLVDVRIRKVEMKNGTVGRV